VDLLKAGGVFQFGDGVTERAFVGEAVVDAVAIHVHDGDEVGGVFADEAEELLALDQSATNTVDLKLLEDAIEVEEEHETDQAPDGLPKVEQGFPGFAGVKERWDKRDDCRGQEQRYADGGAPEPPLATLDASEAVARGQFMGMNVRGSSFGHISKIPRATGD